MAARIHVDRGVVAPGVPAVRSIRDWVRAALATRGTPEGEVAVRIVDETEMRALNARYRHKDYPTNVLAFPAELPKGVDLPLLGDIVVCASVVAREAGEQHKKLRAHWAHMLVHGTLHLLGHDHQRPRAAASMESLEIRVLGALGFPDPYNTD